MQPHLFIRLTGGLRWPASASQTGHLHAGSCTGLRLRRTTHLLQAATPLAGHQCCCARIDAALQGRPRAVGPAARWPGAGSASLQTAHRSGVTAAPYNSCAGRGIAHSSGCLAACHTDASQAACGLSVSQASDCASGICLHAAGGASSYMALEHWLTQLLPHLLQRLPERLQ